jgi:phage RecT family recombinase
MTETVSQAVAKLPDPAGLITPRAQEFGKLLPAHVSPEKFARWSLNVIRKGLGDGKQAEAWQRVLTSEEGKLSVMSALMDCASLGLEPGRTYHMLPFAGTVTGVVDYKGEIELVCNANPRAAVIAQLIHAADKCAFLGANIPPRHEADWMAGSSVRGPVVGGYAYVQMAEGVYSLVVKMTEEEFLKHRALAKTTKIWDEWPEAMRVKTLIHQLRKFVAWSPEKRYEP